MPATQREPLVTVIIATYNSSQTLKLALESVLAQDFADYEVWVVGDACTDDSEEVLTSFGDERLQWTNLPQNSGSQGDPNNEGLRRARGQYIAYLGHDDLWFPWHLSGLVSFIRKTKADLVHPLSALFGHAGLEYTVGPPSTGRTYENHFVFPSCWLHPRHIIEECGMWGDHFRLAMGVDQDFLRRVYLAGKQIAYCPQLSLLKFPSALWRMYALTSLPPQIQYLASMKRDPVTLQHELLFEAATLLARRTNPKENLTQAILRLMLALRRNIGEFYGRGRWPLAPLLHWRSQRMRARQRNIRGLSPYQRT